MSSINVDYASLPVEERLKILSDASEALSNGNVAEGIRLSKLIPLTKEMAMFFTALYGKDFIAKEGYILAKAN